MSIAFITSAIIVIYRTIVNNNVIEISVVGVGVGRGIVEGHLERSEEDGLVSE